MPPTPSKLNQRKQMWLWCQCVSGCGVNVTPTISMFQLEMKHLDLIRKLNPIQPRGLKRNDASNTMKLLDFSATNTMKYLDFTSLS